MDFEEYIEGIRQYKNSYETGMSEALRDISDLGLEEALEKIHLNSDGGLGGPDLFKHYRSIGYFNVLMRKIKKHEQSG